MRTNAVGLIVAVSLHAAVLFAIRLREANRRVESDEPVAVELVMEAGDADFPEPAPLELPAAPEPPPPEIVVEPPAVVAAEPVPEIVTASLATEPARPEMSQRPRPLTRSAGRASAAAGEHGNSGNAQPSYRYNPKPEYPAAARRARQQGVVLLLVEVTEEGLVSDLQLAHSSGFPALDQAAMAAVRHWTFQPARVMGLPVASRPEVPVRFALAP